VRRWRSLTATLAYFNVAWNLLLYILNPAWGSLILAAIWLAVGALWSTMIVKERRRVQAATQRQSFLPGGSVVGARPVVLGPSERLVSLPAGWSRQETEHGTRYIRQCSHWPRDEVKLKDGAVVAYICRRCGHDWADERWVAMKDVEW